MLASCWAQAKLGWKVQGCLEVSQAELGWKVQGCLEVSQALVCKTRGSGGQGQAAASLGTSLASGGQPVLLFLLPRKPPLALALPLPLVPAAPMANG